MTPVDQDPSQARRQVGNADTAACPTASPGLDENGNCLPIPPAGADRADGRQKGPGGGNTSAGALNTGPGAAEGGLGSNQ